MQPVKPGVHEWDAKVGTDVGHSKEDGRGEPGRALIFGACVNAKGLNMGQSVAGQGVRGLVAASTSEIPSPRR